MPASEAAPLRILVVTNLYPGPRSPAFGTFVAGRVDALRRAGQRVSVAAITEDRLHQGVGRKYLRLGLAASGAAIEARLRRRPFDIVEAHIAFPTGLVAWPAARLAGASLVLFCHGSDVTVLPWGSALRARLARWLFGQADLVVANSVFIAGEVTTRLGPLRRPVVVVSPGVEVPPQSDLPDPASRPRDAVLFVGRLVPTKGASVLLEAIRRLIGEGRAVRLTIVGDGPERSNLEAMARAEDIDATFTGPLSHDAVTALMREATVVAVPSTAPEGLGLAALEAMAQGALVVASRIGGLAESIVDGENGRLVPPGDADALAAALAASLDEAATPLGSRQRDAGRATALRHERDAAVRDGLADYRKLVR